VIYDATGKENTGAGAGKKGVFLIKILCSICGRRVKRKQTSLGNDTEEDKWN